MWELAKDVAGICACGVLGCIVGWGTQFWYERWLTEYQNRTKPGDYLGNGVNNTILRVVDNMHGVVYCTYTTAQPPAGESTLLFWRGRYLWDGTKAWKKIPEFEAMLMIVGER